MSDFLATQSQHYAQIEHPLLLLTGTNDDIVPACNHADRLEEQVERIQRIGLKNTDYALHHARAAQVADAIASFAARA